MKPLDTISAGCRYAINYTEELLEIGKEKRSFVWMRY